MRKYSSTSPIIALTFALAACGADEGKAPPADDRNASNITVTNPQGETATVTSGANARLPLGFSILPGANVVSNSTIATNDGRGSVLYFTTPSVPAEVVTFYRRQAEAAGIAIVLEQTAGEARTIAGEGEGGKNFMLTATPGDNGTGVQLMVGEAP